MRDWELENLAVDDIESALEYIGKSARYRNYFLADTDSLYSVPLFLSHEILKNPKKLTEPKPCH